MNEPIKTGDNATIIAGALGDKGPNIGKQVTVGKLQGEHSKYGRIWSAQKPVAWAIKGCSRMWSGEFAEIDAKAEAVRCGGTCYAYPLYTAPTLTTPNGWAEAADLAELAVDNDYGRNPVALQLARTILDMDKLMKEQG